MSLLKKGQFLVMLDKGIPNFLGRNKDNCVVCDKVIPVTKNCYEVSHYDYTPVLVCSNRCADFYVLSKI